MSSINISVAMATYNGEKYIRQQLESILNQSMIVDEIIVVDDNLLERCKEMCDILIVGVCDDKYVTEIKKKQPVYPEDQRVRILNALKVVDHAELVTIEETDDKMLALEKFKFDVLFSGDDWKGSERYLRTEKQFAEYGASIEYLPYTKGISTTDIKNKMKE